MDYGREATVEENEDNTIIYEEDYKSAHQYIIDKFNIIDKKYYKLIKFFILREESREKLNYISADYETLKKEAQ